MVHPPNPITNIKSVRRLSFAIFFIRSLLGGNKWILLIWLRVFDVLWRLLLWFVRMLRIRLWINPRIQRSWIRSLWVALFLLVSLKKILTNSLMQSQSHMVSFHQLYGNFFSQVGILFSSLWNAKLLKLYNSIHTLSITHSVTLSSKAFYQRAGIPQRRVLLQTTITNNFSNQRDDIIDSPIRIREPPLPHLQRYPPIRQHSLLPKPFCQNRRWTTLSRHGRHLTLT